VFWGVRVITHPSVARSDAEVVVSLEDDTSSAPSAKSGRRHRFDLSQIEVNWDPERQTLWSFMTPERKPNFGLAMLRDLKSWQRETSRVFAPGGDELRYLVLGSRFPGVFNLGGDLDYVLEQIANRDEQSLFAYGKSCVEIIYRNMQSLDLPIVTIALIQGDALGGGFEAALSFNVLVAERGTRLGLPETMFGMFPGVGAHSILMRRLGGIGAERLMISGATHSAEEMYDMGLVHVLAEPGQGEQAVADYIRRNARHHTGHRGIYRAAREVDPVTVDELERIVHIWVETALSLGTKDIKMMRRLADAQSRAAALAG
jgi:DSF synthase